MQPSSLISRWSSRCDLLRTPSHGRSWEIRGGRTPSDSFACESPSDPEGSPIPSGPFGYPFWSLRKPFGNPSETLRKPFGNPSDPFGSLRQLLDAGADLKATDNDGFDALVAAATGGSAVVAKLLLERGERLRPPTDLTRISPASPPISADLRRSPSRSSAPRSRPISQASTRT